MSASATQFNVTAIAGGVTAAAGFRSGALPAGSRRSQARSTSP